MKTLTWILKFVLFPLLPFFFGASVRCLHAGSFKFDSLSPAELGFSMALLTLVISVSTSRIENPELRDALTQLFQLGAIIYISLFSWSIFLETDIHGNQTAILHVIQEKVDNQKPIIATDFSRYSKTNELILARLRWITVCLSVVIIPLAIYTNKKYDLEKL